ncbi:MAG: threonine--tRNA ligase [bacterium]|nr:threonine--tRNA ligase [bacterium]
MTKQSDQLDHIRHSLAHLLASAVLEMFPKAELGVGPTIETGFYYDFLLPRSVTPEDIKQLEKRMRTLAKENLEFKKSEMSTTEAKKYFTKLKQPFKVELVKDIEKFGTTKTDEILNSNTTQEEVKKNTKGNEKVSLYETGKFIDLCRGGHVKTTKEIKTDSFKLDKVAGAYWRGSEKNPQMQRIYGLAFESKKELDEYINQREEAKKRDHKILGPKLDLFTFSELVGSGLPLWTPKGTVIRHVLDNYVWQLRKKRGYVKVEIPHITKKDLYERSGHWDKFKDELFKIKTREGHIFALKPMNCPHHTQIFARKAFSYREMPQRYASTTMQYRDEQTGELAGLSRVRSISIDDAHVFCRHSQVKEEAVKIWEIIDEFYKGCGFPKLEVRLSLHDPKHPEKYLGDKQVWAKAEGMLRELIKQKKIKAEEALGEAAFYGPKIDFIARDSIGREWQVATIQLDMNLPERFDLACTNEKGEQERIVMLHAAIMGSMERFLSIIIEHFAGAFPTWISPVQVAVLPISDNQVKYSQAVVETLEKNNIRVEFYNRAESIGKKIREAEMNKIPYMLIVGEKETGANTVSVRARNQKDLGSMKLEKFVDKIQKEIETKSL